MLLSALPCDMEEKEYSDTARGHVSQCSHYQLAQTPILYHSICVASYILLQTLSSLREVLFLNYLFTSSTRYAVGTQKVIAAWVNEGHRLSEES